MSDSLKHRVSRFLFAVVATGCLIAGPSHADNIYVSDTKISVVTVTGGADTANPGTTCIKVQATVLPACASSFLAIPNNNKQLIAAALLNKATGGNVWVYYVDNAAANHCPGLTFTPCSVVSIESR